MACPKCGCKVTYEYAGALEDALAADLDDRLERCAACGEIFDVDDHVDEDDDE
jgi:hypothetical protein